MEGSTPGPKASTWKPEVPASRVPAARKEGSFAAAQRRQRFLMTLLLQAMLAVVLIAATFFARRELQTVSLYAWTLIVPAGFGLVYALAFFRGERARRDGTWTPAFERNAARSAYLSLGGVLLLWAAGMVAILFVL